MEHEFTPPQLTLRQLTPADAEQALDLVELVFLAQPLDEAQRAVHTEELELDRGRATGVFDGDELVGLGSITPVKLTVPGGVLPMAGVLIIGVKATHRRRGIMSRLIGHQLHAVHDQGLEPMAGLTASESVIYGRFGYGQATYQAIFTVPRHRAALRAVGGTDEVRVRLVPTQDSIAFREAILARQAVSRPGMVAGPESWGRARALDLPSWRGGRSRLRTVLAERGGRVVGFARYRTREDAGPATEVDEIHADDAAAFVALARYLLDIDLTTCTKFFRQPVDSPLMYLLADMRSADMGVSDGLYLRLVDVDRALAGRTYAAPLDVVLEITDELCPWNAGRWRLAGDQKTAECVRTSAPADLAIDIRELAAVYLGGTTLAALDQAALVTELRPGAITEASLAFSTPLAAWLNSGL
jgi:predicted acetyltransferase